MVAAPIAWAHAGVWHLAHVLWQLAAADRPVLAGTAVAVAVLLAAVLAARLVGLSRRPAPASTGPGGAPAPRERRDGTPRYTDPDAPGRARPRAPCAAPRPRRAA